MPRRTLTARPTSRSRSAAGPAEGLPSRAASRSSQASTASRPFSTRSSAVSSCWTPRRAVGTAEGGRVGSSASMAGTLMAYIVVGRLPGAAPSGARCTAATRPTTACRSRSHSGPPLKPSVTWAPPSTSRAIRAAPRPGARRAPWAADCRWPIRRWSRWRSCAGGTVPARRPRARRRSAPGRRDPRVRHLSGLDGRASCRRGPRRHPHLPVRPVRLAHGRPRHGAAGA